MIVCYNCKENGGQWLPGNVLAKCIYCGVIWEPAAYVPAPDFQFGEKGNNDALSVFAIGVALGLLCFCLYAIIIGLPLL